MNQSPNSAIKIIAIAIEKDTESLKELLNRNGIFTSEKTSKDELQAILTAALAKSKSFQKEFENWVLSRANLNAYKNTAGDLPTSIGYQFGQSGSLETTNTATSQTFGGMTFGTTATTNPAPTEPVKTGFFSGITANTILDFAKTGMNNFVALQQSKTDKAIVDASIEKERANIQNSQPGKQSASMNKALIIGGSLVGVVGLVFGIIWYNKNKK